MTLRVGLLSTAKINLALLGGARAAEGVEVVAVASRSAERAEAYAAEHGIGRAHGSYEALLGDPDVDAVYVPLPNSLHVAVGDPGARGGQARAVREAADAPPGGRRGGVRRGRARRPRAGGGVHVAPPPAGAAAARAAAAEGAVGELRLVRAAFSFDIFGGGRPDDVRLQADLDGGGLMDVGCYCVSAMRLLAGEPAAVSGRRIDGGDGVDVRFTGTLAFAGGVLGSFDCGLDMVARSELEVVGDAGSLFLPDPWHSRARADRAAPAGRERADRGRGRRPVRVRARGLRGRGARRAPASVRARRRGRARRATIAALYRAAESGARRGALTRQRQGRADSSRP